MRLGSNQEKIDLSLMYLKVNTMQLEPIFIFAILFGLYTLVGATFKLKFYWERARIRHARKTFGEQKARILYAISGGVLVLIGLAGIAGVF